MTCDFNSLECLLKASSKGEVVKLCHDVFRAVNRNTVQFPDTLLTHCQQTLKLNQEQAHTFVSSLGSILKQAVFQGSTNPHDIVALFPDGFHKNLRDLISKIIIDNMADWKSQAVSAHVSLPKLADFDWRVDVKTASDTMARMSVPTCILSLQVESGLEPGETTRGHQTMNVELSKETLDTMLDGLSKIRDQLSSVANRMECWHIGDPFALHHNNRALHRRVIPRWMPQSPRMISVCRRGPEVRASMYVIHLPSM